jgi:hypothetical protein
LALPVGKVTIMVDDNVAGLTSGLGSNNFLGGDNLSGEGRLVLVNVYRDSGLVIVWTGLQEVLLAVDGSAEKRKRQFLNVRVDFSIKDILERAPTDIMKHSIVKHI